MSLISNALNHSKAASNQILDASHFTDVEALATAASANKPFPTTLEKAYEKSRDFQFLKRNYKLLFIATLFYTIFLITDIIIFSRFSVLPFISRLFVIVLMFVALVQIFYFNKGAKITNIITATCIFIIFHCLVGSLVLPQPQAQFYHYGIVPTLIACICLFRFCFKHLLIITSFTLITYCCYLLFGVGFSTMSFNINDISKSYNSIIFVSLILISIFGLYTSWLVEQVHRSEWLKNQLIKQEKTRQHQLMMVMNKRAWTDSLTKLFNRRYFDKYMSTQWEWHGDNNKPLSVIMIDIDWFKPYNDNYGHQRGDLCLKRIAKTLNKTIQKDNDNRKVSNKGLKSVLSRYGGEEFIILLPYSTHERALKVAKALRKNIFNKKLVHEYSPLQYCSISLGVATANSPSNSKKDLAMAQLIKQADDALYAAKNAGKNTVFSAEELTTEDAS